MRALADVPLLVRACCQAWTLSAAGTSLRTQQALQHQRHCATPECCLNHTICQTHPHRPLLACCGSLVAALLDCRYVWDIIQAAKPGERQPDGPLLMTLQAASSVRTRQEALEC